MLGLKHAVGLPQLPCTPGLRQDLAYPPPIYSPCVPAVRRISAPLHLPVRLRQAVCHVLHQLSESIRTAGEGSGILDRKVAVQARHIVCRASETALTSDHKKSAQLPGS